MPRNFNWLSNEIGADRGIRFWLRIAIGTLALCNAVALYLYFFPPGGSRQSLAAESEGVRQQIAATRAKAVRLRTVAGKVETGSGQSSEFQSKYILPKRLAYGTVVAEIQRMVKASGLQDRDAVYSEEPIEGTPDLTLITTSANYEGTYENLKKFLYEVDHSPMLIMLENLTASPQQKGNGINTNIRFQAVIREDAAVEPARGQP